MLYKIIYNLMHPLYGALPVPYVPVQVTCSPLVTHCNTYASPHCRTLLYCRTFILLSVSMWNGLADPVVDGVRLAGFKSRANFFLNFFIAPSCFISFRLLPFFPFSSFCLSVSIMGLGSLDRLGVPFTALALLAQVVPLHC